MRRCSGGSGSLIATLVPDFGRHPNWPRGAETDSEFPSLRDEPVSRRHRASIRSVHRIHALADFAQAPTAWPCRSAYEQARIHLLAAIVCQSRVASARGRRGGNTIRRRSTSRRHLASTRSARSRAVLALLANDYPLTVGLVGNYCSPGSGSARDREPLKVTGWSKGPVCRARSIDLDGGDSRCISTRRVSDA
jgi:hypothetical protein